MVGGLVACFVLRVLETHQYLYFRKRGSIRSSLLFLLGGGWSAGARISLRVGSFSPYVRGGKKVFGGHKCGAPPKFEVVWAGHNGRCLSRYAEFLTPVVRGRPGPIYRDGTWRM